MVNEHIYKIEIGENNYLIEPRLYAVANTTNNATYSFSIDGLIPAKGVTIQIKFPSTNIAAVNFLINGGLTPVDAKYKGENITAGLIQQGHTYTFVYDNSVWNLVGDVDTPRAPISHMHGNITNDGKLSTASYAVVTDSNGAITTESLAVTDNTTIGEKSSTFVAKVTQDAKGKITVTKATTQVHWDDVTNKPSTFSPSTHNHDDKYVARITNSVDNVIARFNGTDGQIQNSLIKIDDDGSLLIPHKDGVFGGIKIYRYDATANKDTVSMVLGIGSANSNHGLYDLLAPAANNTTGAWILYADATNHTWNFHGTASQALNANTVNNLTVQTAVPQNAVFTDTTYTFTSGTNGFTVTPSGGSEQTITVTPSITNNITGTGTANTLTKFTGTNTIGNSGLITDDSSNLTVPGSIYFGGIANNSSKGILIYSSTVNKHGLWYFNEDLDKLTLDASGNANSKTGADFGINVHGAGTLTNRNNRIPHTGNTTGTVGSASRPVYVNSGTITAITELNLDVGNTGITNTANKRVLWSTTGDNGALQGYITVSSNGKMGIHATSGIYIRPGDTNGAISTTTGVVVLNNSFSPYNTTNDNTMTLGDSTHYWKESYSIKHYGSGIILTPTANSGSDSADGFKLLDETTKYANLYIQTKGTTNAVGYAALALGNNVGQGTNKNAKGVIYLYGTGVRGTQIETDYVPSTNSPSHSVMKFPNYAGTGYLTHTSSSAAEGGQYQPVYSAANGRITAITHVGVSYGGTGKTSWNQFTIPYLSGQTTFGEVVPNTSEVKKILTMTGTGTTGATPEWSELSALGLASPLRFIGTTTTQIADNDTTNSITINSISYTPNQGDVVLYNGSEFLWNGTRWDLLGDASSFKKVQTAFNNSTGSADSTNTSTTFIYSFSQDENGNIKDIKTRALDTTGPWSGNAATASGIPQTVTTTASWRKVLLTGGDVYAAHNTAVSNRTAQAHQAVGISVQPSTGTLRISGPLITDSTTSATSTETGALIVGGGAGIAESLYVGENIVIPSTGTLIQTQGSGNNYTTAIRWLTGGTGWIKTGQTYYNYQPQIGQLNGISSNSTHKGAITLLPYATDTSPWGGKVGLFISYDTIKWEDKVIPNTGNTTGSVGTSTTPVYIDEGEIKTCTAYSSASVNYAESAGSATKLGTSDIGDAETIVYLDEGTPTTGKKAFLLTGGTQISTNANLNTYKTIGNYYSDGDTRSKAFTNTPYGAAASNSHLSHTLKVEASLGSGTTYLRQWWRAYNSGVEAERTSTNSGSSWSEWRTKVFKNSNAATKEGDTNKPVYIAANGQATAISYTIGKSVPSDAVFTDHYAWTDITGKPDTFPPTIGTTATTAMAGNTVVNKVKTTAVTDSVEYKILMNAAGASPTSGTAYEAVYSANATLNPSAMKITLTKTNHSGDHGLILDNTEANKVLKLGYVIGNSGNGGIYDYTHSAWKVKIAIDGTTTFTGDVTGNVTGNVSGSSGSCTGNAATATKLKTARSLWGNSFDGSASIYGDLDWDSDTYRQRIHITDDSTAKTAVFTFQQSIDSGSTYGNLLTIQDDGYVWAGSYAKSTNQSYEHGIGVQGGAGKLFLWASASTSGDKGLYAYTANEATKSDIIRVNQSNQIKTLATIVCRVNVTYTNTASDSSSPMIKLTDNADATTAASGKWMLGIDHVVSNLAAGGNTCIITGKANSTNNAGVFGFHYAGDANDGNYVDISLYSNNGLLKVYKTGHAYIKTATHSPKLMVNDGAATPTDKVTLEWNSTSQSLDFLFA